MKIYLILSIICIIVFIGLLFFLMYLIKDEKELKVVDNKYLKSLGKSYTREQFEDALYQMYVNIISGIDNDDYNYVKDAVSDENYNRMLLTKKEEKENNISHVTSDITKQFVRLVSLKVVNDLEIAKLWVKFSCFEYRSELVEREDETGRMITEEKIISGSKDSKIVKNYILTFVKTKTTNELIVCPNCRFTSYIATQSKCLKCESEVLKKNMHWVYVGKEEVKM